MTTSPGARKGGVPSGRASSGTRTAYGAGTGTSAGGGASGIGWTTGIQHPTRVCPLRWGRSAGRDEPSADVVRHAVDDRRHGQEKHDVPAVHDLDAVGVRDPEPLLRHLGDVLATLGDAVLVVDDVHGVAHAQLALLELEQLVAACVLEDEGVADPHGLAVHLERASALLVLDPGVVADRDQLLPHPVRRPADSSPLVATFLTAFPTPTSQSRGCLRDTDSCFGPPSGHRAWGRVSPLDAGEVQSCEVQFGCGAVLRLSVSAWLRRWSAGPLSRRRRRRGPLPRRGRSRRRRARRRAARPPSPRGAGGRSGPTRGAWRAGCGSTEAPRADRPPKRRGSRSRPARNSRPA